jgi:hypothetical protein
MMQPSSHSRIHSYRQAISAFPVRAGQGTGWVFPVLFASQDFTTESARARHVVVQSHVSRLVSVDSCLWSEVRPVRSQRASADEGPGKHLSRKYQQGVTDLALGGERDRTACGLFGWETPQAVPAQP